MMIPLGSCKQACTAEVDVPIRLPFFLGRHVFLRGRGKRGEVGWIWVEGNGTARRQRARGLGRDACGQGGGGGLLPDGGTPFFFLAFGWWGSCALGTCL